MADPKEIEAILTTQVVTPRSDKAKGELSDFIRRISKRPEIAEKTDAEIAVGIQLYLEQSNKIINGQVTAVPSAGDYENAIKAIKDAKAKEATQQRKSTLKAESSARDSVIAEERASWQAIQDAIALAKEQDKRNQDQRQELSRQHADASANLETEHMTMLAETLRAFKADKENIERSDTLKKQEQVTQEELRFRTAQLKARNAQRNLPLEKQQQQLLTEAEKEAQQRKLKDQQEQKKQIQALIERLVAREAKKGKEAADIKRTELNERYKDTLSVPDSQVPATTDAIQKAKELEETQRKEQEELLLAKKADKEKQERQYEEKLQAKKSELEARRERQKQKDAQDATARKEKTAVTIQSAFRQQQARKTLKTKQQEKEEVDRAAILHKQSEERQQLGQEKLHQANAKMKEELKTTISSGKFFGMFGGHEEKRDMAITRLTDIYCHTLSENSKVLEALNMDNEDKNLIQHNVTQMGPKIERFCQEHQYEPIEVFNKNMEEWAKKEATELAVKSGAVMSVGFRDKYPEPPKNNHLDRTFTNTEDVSSVRPSASPQKKHGIQKQHGK
ncbi:MAG: hypothetical protein KBC27_00115 [Rickettsiales bacterium]|nr:hypothetical protein [Rickettsiales bacterium]